MKTRITVGIWFILSTFLPQQEPQFQVDVTLPDRGAEARCGVQRDGQTIAQQQGRRLVFQCPATSELISCDFVNAEPTDVPLATVCRTHFIPTQSAEEVRIVVKAPVLLTIAWLSGSGRPDMPILATRQRMVEQFISMPVARSFDRFVRFSRPGFAPVTVAAADLIGAAGWVLPDPLPGGELFVRVQSALVSPQAYRLSGPIATVLQPKDGVVVARGLPAGLYQLTPVYAGGKPGRV